LRVIAHHLLLSIPRTPVQENPAPQTFRNTDTAHARTSRDAPRMSLDKTLLITDMPNVFLILTYAMTFSKMHCIHTRRLSPKKP
jgi:hypothetical protein